MPCGCRGSGAANQTGSTNRTAPAPVGPAAPGYTWNGPRRRTGDTGVSGKPKPAKRPA